MQKSINSTLSGELGNNHFKNHDRIFNNRGSGLNFGGSTDTAYDSYLKQMGKSPIDTRPYNQVSAPDPMQFVQDNSGLSFGALEDPYKVDNLFGGSSELSFGNDNAGGDSYNLFRTEFDDQLGKNLVGAANGDMEMGFDSTGEEGGFANWWNGDKDNAGGGAMVFGLGKLGLGIANSISANKNSKRFARQQAAQIEEEQKRHDYSVAKNEAYVRNVGSAIHG